MTINAQAPNQNHLIASYFSLKQRCAHNSSHSTNTQKLLLCSACKFTAYCNSNCQSADWSRHKIVCKDLKELKKEVKHETKSENKSFDYQSLIDQIIVRPISNPVFKDSKVFICSNEIYIDKSQEQLRKTKSAGNLVIGVSGFCTLDLVSVREGIKYVLIVDSSLLTQLFWKNMRVIIKSSRTNHECRLNIYEHLDKHIREYGHTQSNAVDNFTRLLMQKTSWLDTPDKYQRIKTIFDENHFAFILLDLVDSEACQKIGDLNASLKLTTDIFYLSNVINFITPENFKLLGESLDSLTNPHTTIVDTEEQPYKITPLISFFYSTRFIQHCLMVPHVYGTPPILDLKQRVSIKGETIESHYPIIALAKKVNIKDLYFQFGLQKGYYKKEEMIGIQEKVAASLPGNVNFKDHEEAIIRLLYPNKVTKP